MTEGDKLKRFFNIFYTTPCKAFFVITLIVCSWLMNSELTGILNLYKQDSAALVNAFMQGDKYDYESSYFLKSSIETAIDDVMEYSLVYNRKASSPYTEYGATATQEYNELIDRLQSYKNFRFALANHKTDLIVSNIPSINGKSTDTTVRRYFGEDRNLLIVRDVRNPIFENGPLTEYVEYASEQAKKYTDNFDIYISFGDKLEFAGDSENFSQRHTDYLSRVVTIFKRITVYLAVMLVIFISLIIVAGKRETGGKTYPGVSDRLPNDLTFLLCFIMYISISALYENSLYMALRVTSSENFWLNTSPEFYLARSNVSMVLMIIIITSFSCALKRQISRSTLISNTHIYRFIKNYKKKNPI